MENSKTNSGDESHLNLTSKHLIDVNDSPNVALIAQNDEIAGEGSVDLRLVSQSRSQQTTNPDLPGENGRGRDDKKNSHELTRELMEFEGLQAAPDRSVHEEMGLSSKTELNSEVLSKSVQVRLPTGIVMMHYGLIYFCIRKLARAGHCQHFRCTDHGDLDE